MTFHPPSRRDILSACSHIGPGDGKDPRYDRRGPSGRPQGRKSKQLCRQVEHTLRQVLLSCGDLVLLDLEVVRAEPIGGGRLLVTLTWSVSAGQQTSGDALARLEQARGLLRSEVAASIHRRKAPDLVFQLVESSS